MNTLEIHYSLRGKALPADHGYSLYSALKKTVMNGQSLPPEVLLCSVPGVPNRDGKIYLKPSSKVRLRCPADQVRQWYRLFQNVVLDIRGHLIRLVRPQLRLPEASNSLKARLVTFKLSSIDDRELPAHFLNSCDRALKEMGIDGRVFIDSNDRGDLARRALKIKDKTVIGYGIGVEDLSEEDSIKLQSFGLGGRKHFGCGWFYPAREEMDAT